MIKPTPIILLFVLTLTACGEKPTDSLKQQALGKQLFFDPILSKNKTQFCATCHNPQHGFIDNRDNGVLGAASLGDDGHSLGDRNAPTAAYAMFSPEFHFDVKNKQWIGGQFHDGREKDLAGQAGGPPLNPIEMNMPSKQVLTQRLQQQPSYNQQFKKLFGNAIFKDANKAYDKMAQSIATFQQTSLFAPFDSKYDRYLRGEYELSDLEDLGRSLFFSNNNTNCASCHQLNSRSDTEKETFTNYEYHNIGIPINTALRQKNKITEIDRGLLSNTQVNDPQQDGKFKVPTLRNVAITAPYMHNGVFQELETVILFYDKYINKQRINNPETNQPWKSPETPATVNTDVLTQGKKLPDRKVTALVAFLKTLTDQRYEHLLEKN